jgi:Tfp pilus assembly protein PilV
VEPDVIARGDFKMVRKSLITVTHFLPVKRGVKSHLKAVPSGCVATESINFRLDRRRDKSVCSESGVTLIETMVASLILIIVVVSLLPVLTMGFQATEQQGDTATRTTEYASDKMESLLNLSFADAATNTAVFPASTAGGTGLGGAMAASTTVGAVAPAAAVAGYVDYLDLNGNLLTTAAGAFYARQWSITTDATATLKTITVSVTSLQGAGVLGIAPSTKLASVKSSLL